MFFKKSTTNLASLTFLSLLYLAITPHTSYAYFDCSRPPPASAGAAYYSECGSSGGGSSGNSYESCDPGYGLCPGGGCAPLGSMCCRSGGYCPRGKTCTPNGKCLPDGYTNCGDGRGCKPGYTCGRGADCIPQGTVDCGDGKYCDAGDTCGRGGGCIPKGTVDCGNGKHCPSGSVCAKAPDDSCIPTTSPRVCTDRKHYCDPGYECTDEVKCRPDDETRARLARERQEKAEHEKREACGARSSRIAVLTKLVAEQNKIASFCSDHEQIAAKLGAIIVLANEQLSHDCTTNKETYRAYIEELRQSVAHARTAAQRCNETSLYGTKPSESPVIPRGHNTGHTTGTSGHTPQRPKEWVSDACISVGTPQYIAPCEKGGAAYTTRVSPTHAEGCPSDDRLGYTYKENGVTSTSYALGIAIHTCGGPPTDVHATID